jgi:hypothetical protein
MYSKLIPCLSREFDISYRHDIISFCSLLYVLSFWLLFFQVALEIRIPILLSADQWIRTLEQILLLILIVGRWFQKLKTYNKEQNDMISCLYEMSNSRDKQGISLEYMMKVVPEMRTNLDNYVGITVTVSIHLLVDY